MVCLSSPILLRLGILGPLVASSRRALSSALALSEYCMRETHFNSRLHTEYWQGSIDWWRRSGHPHAASFQEQKPAKIRIADGKGPKNSLRPCLDIRLRLRLRKKLGEVGCNACQGVDKDSAGTAVQQAA